MLTILLTIMNSRLTMFSHGFHWSIFHTAKARVKNSNSDRQVARPIDQKPLNEIGILEDTLWINFNHN